jgi:putative SOS response-associated peptidase YedK
MRWGLVPCWAKDTKIGYKTINGLKTVATKPAFIRHC